MNSFKDCCDNGCFSQGGSDNFGGFGNGNLRLGRSLSFHRDCCQDVPSSFKNVGSFFLPSGNIQGVIHSNLNGDVVGRLQGKIEGLPALLGCVGKLASLGNMGGNVGVSLPISVQFGDRAV